MGKKTSTNLVSQQDLIILMLKDIVVHTICFFLKKSFLRNRCYFYRFGSLKEEVKYEI